MSIEPEVQRYALNGPTMGTRYSAIFFAPAGADAAAIGAALQAAVDTVDMQMSTWKPDSDLSRLNVAPIGQWQSLPPELCKVLATALEIGAASGGLFDIGVGELVNAWGFGPEGSQPDAPRLAGLAERPRPSAARDLELDALQLRARKRAPVRLDLSGIAKGFGVDQLAHCLEQHGISDYLVSIDGEMRAGGPKPGGEPWVVGIERPERKVRDVARVVGIVGCAIATSGDYRHWHEIEGRSVSHTMDPRTGAPLGGRLASVTVLGADCMRADAWATVLMVLGETEGPAFARSHGLEALFIVRDGDRFREVATGPGFGS